MNFTENPPFDLSDPAGDIEQVMKWAHYLAGKFHFGAADSICLGALVGALEETARTRDALAGKLAEIMVLLKGPPPEGSEWGFGDAVELVQALVDKSRGGLH